MSAEQLAEIEAVARAGGSDPVLTIYLVNEIRRLQQERADLLGVLANPSRIKDYRTRLKLTKKQLAARLHVAMNYIDRIENGASRPGLDAAYLRGAWDLVMAAIEYVFPEPDPVPNQQPAVWGLVIADMHARDLFGFKKYGARLQPFNGRDPLADAYQEALDLVVYLRQALFERDSQ